MSVSNISDTSVDHSQKQAWDVLADHNGIKIDDKFVLKLTKGSRNVNREVKNSCKVFHFSSEWNFEEIFSKIHGLELKDYPQLFIFVIDGIKEDLKSTNGSPDKKLKRECDVNKLIVVLQKFESARPIILQMTNEDDEKTQIYYKDYNAEQFLSLYRKQNNFAKVEDFPTFLCSFLTGNSDISGENRFKVISNITNSSLVLKFLRTLNLRDSFIEQIILEVAFFGTKASFIAALDAPFDSDGRILGIRDQKYISDVFWDDDPKNDESVLQFAIKNEETEVINFLIFNWTHLIQQLPFDRQAIISTDAFNKNKLDVLCDLLDIADYPFPKDFKIDIVDHDRLRRITAERNDFKHAIEMENFKTIDEFATKNRNLKLVYNPSNKSALTEAVDSKKYAVFYYLRSLGFEGAKSDEILANLSEEEKNSAKTQAKQQKNINVNKSLKHIHRSVHKLFVNSFIHDRRTSKEKEANYWAKIMQWYTEVNEIAPKLLEVAASCDDLKIFFDFESDSVDSIDPEYSNSLGLTYEKRKWIFIGAKFKTKEREQQIKGVIAHELCHYVMCLVYNNNLLPYYKNAENIRNEFDEVVKEMDKWSQSGSNETDDECNKIISSVFTDYRKEKHHLELIVRPVHILVEFHDNNEKSNYLEKKYENLFNFWTNRVLHDLQEYCNKNLDIVKLNRIFKLLPDILNSKIDINCMKIEETLIASKLAIVTTNIPKLLFINIHNYLQNSFGSLLDSKNFFIEPNKVDILEHWNDFWNMCQKAPDLNIFIDCTKGDVSQSLGNIFVKKNFNFIFGVSNEQQSAKLMTIFEKKNMMNTENKINYNWNDLTQESQNLLLKTRIDFQNNSQVSLMDLLKSENTTGTQDLSEIIEDQMLYLLTENQKISINTKLENELNEEKFIFKTRRFRVKQKDANNNKEAVSQEELLLNIKNKQYVLISDQAGNGKSWAMKNFTKILREQNPTSWVTYVDLKQFIDEFKAQEGEPEFSTFMIKYILNLQQNFEEKVFQKFYNNGKVFIIFDGFDEIAPDYAQVVSKLAQNFQSNGGNQLWIATRDYFEVDLMEKLKLDYAYGLHEMTENEGIELITRSWVFMDFVANKNVPKSRVQFDEVIKSSTEYKNYQLKALELVEKVTVSWNCSIGLPLLFKLIAGLKNEKNVERLKKSEIFDKFIRNLYIRWSDDKGPIRKEASVDSQQFELNFYRFPQYHAILSLFPKLAAILYPENDGSKWKNEEIIACGILTIKDGKIYFIHETFREYFVADFITKALKKSKIDETVLELFVEILTVEKFGVIRMFLNDMIDNVSILTKIQPKVQIHVAKFNIMTSFDDFFISNLKNLVDLVLNILNQGNYEQVLEILRDNLSWITRKTKDSEIFQKFQEFIFDFLKVNDLKKLIIEKGVLQGIIKSSLEIEMFEDFVKKMEAKTDQEFIREALMSERNYIIFSSLSSSPYINVHKVQKILEIMEKYLTVDEIFELMSNFDAGGSVFQTYFWRGNKENLKILWTEIEHYFTARKIQQKFKELVKQHKKFNENILLYYLDNNIRHDSIDFYKTLWELLLKTFEDRAELKDFVLQKDFKRLNIVHKFMKKNVNQVIFEWTIKILNETFEKAQFQEILQFKGWNEMILLKYAARSSSSEVFKILCNIFPDLCGTNEKFLEMLNEVVEDGENIFDGVVSYSSSKVFEFMIQELEKIASRDKIKEILSQPTSGNRNLLQLAAKYNNSLELHKSLWKTIQEYCEESEITHFITYVDYFGKNLLFIVVRWNTKEIVELTWNEIKKNLNYDKQVQYLKLKGEDGENLIQCSYRNIFHTNKVAEWVKNLIKEYGIE